MEQAFDLLRMVSHVIESVEERATKILRSFKEVLFPFANVGRISPIITHCADYVELFMRTYIADRGPV
jgi:hypothetical protein